MAASRRLPALILSAFCAAVPARAAAPPDVFVPNLWDPASPPPKPDPAALKPLLIVTGQDDPPFAFTLPDGTPAGFDVDLARALCDELKVTCTVQARRWDTILPAVAAGAGDAAVASVAITPANLAAVDFTSPYYRTPARFVAPVAAAAGDVLPGTVRGKRIGVQGGTAHEAYLRAFFPAATLVPFGSAADLRAAVAAGRVDLAFGDGIAFAGWLNGPAGSACCAFAGGPFTDARFFGEGAGIAVKRGREPLRVALDYALWRLARDGTYADLWLKYFPVSPF
ncbi:transporter substrate-binding domain-containing protein [Lichenibacterium minor]|uniref:Transporter substrate-binding domain-containing protein n=1 Tax=Lichenibacterium minor TaxID=2316528 RepID=A0A4Q2U0F8_9HYPH|nr:transporter substrate-binding domain-containing protein [Lichenibacterium minor]RYC29762.1 transporter substrate-binding domain-containing protein [Lichenibacterium minor]